MNKWFEVNQPKIIISLLVVIILMIIGAVIAGYYYRGEISDLQKQVLSAKVAEQNERITNVELIISQQQVILSKSLDVLSEMNIQVDKQFKKYQDLKPSIDSLKQQADKWESTVLQFSRSSRGIPASPVKK